MKTPETILASLTVVGSAKHGEYLYDAREIKEAMKEYAKQWVEIVVRETAAPSDVNWLMTEYSGKISAQ